MNSNASSEKKYSYRRFLIQYDPIIGYRFIPNTYARIKSVDNTFVIQTNEQGFRDNISFDKLNDGKLNVLALGDSYLAGDQINNHERFMNIISERFNINVLNMGLPGSGSDQQLLIQEKIACKWHYDILLIVPFLHHIQRNLVSFMYNRDWATKRKIDIKKPYFDLVDGKKLVLRNNPVSRSKNYFIKEWGNDKDLSTNDNLSLSIIDIIKSQFRTVFPNFHGWMKRLQFACIGLAYNTNLIKRDIEYTERDTYGWQLMRAIFERMIRNAGERPVIILPIPFHEHIIDGAYPYYLDRFREIQSSFSNVNIIDILPTFKSLSKKAKRELHVPDGHFSSKANQIIAKVCSPVFSKLIESHGKNPSKENNAISVTKENSKFILGISCFYHDSAAAIIKDGKIIAAAQEERFTRIKHDKSFPSNAVNYCLEEARIDGKDLHAVVYYDNEYLTLERMIATQLYISEKKKKQLMNSIPGWVSTKFNIWSHIRKEMNYTGPLFRAVHHRSHAASAFYPSPFQEAAIVTVDGVGEWSTTTIGTGNSNNITILKEIRFPHSLGLLYSAFTSFCGFKVNSGEYKLMGLAPYGRPIYRDKILQNLIEVKEDGSYKLNLRYFAFLEGSRMTNGHFANLFDGLPRERESMITQRECDLASSVQAVTEEIMLRIVSHAYKITGKDNLVLAGGVALNCVANGKILKEGPFKNIWIQPAAGDAGGALGAALDLWYGTWRNSRELGTTDQQDSCFGPSFSDTEIKSFLDYHNYRYHTLTKKNRADLITNYLLEEKVVGHFSGRMEYGPRALGSRSILADPRKVEMQKILNMKIKYRESFRPFAPIVLEEKISDYFELDKPSPYMLLVAPVNNKIKIGVIDEENQNILIRLKYKRSSIPAVTHVDYSARIQSVSRERYPELYDILRVFEQKTGCGVLANTSFNVRGEPIVCMPEDAYRCFMRTEMDVLIMNNFLLKKEEQPKWQEDKDWRSEYELD